MDDLPDPESVRYGSVYVVRSSDGVEGFMADACEGEDGKELFFWRPIDIQYRVVRKRGQKAKSSDEIPCGTK